jgi:hypothetical protein
LGFNEKEFKRLSDDQKMAIYNGKVYMDAKKYPFYMAVWNRLPPKPTNGGNAQKFNGHDGSDWSEEGHEAVVLDNEVGKRTGDVIYASTKVLPNIKNKFGRVLDGVRMGYQPVEGNVRMGMGVRWFAQGTVLQGIWEKAPNGRDVFILGKIENNVFIPGTFPAVKNIDFKGMEARIGKTDFDEGKVPILVSPSSHKPNLSKTATVTRIKPTVDVPDDQDDAKTTLNRSVNRETVNDPIDAADAELFMQAYLDNIEGKREDGDELVKQLLVQIDKYHNENKKDQPSLAKDFNNRCLHHIVRAYASLLLGTMDRDESRRLEALYKKHQGEGSLGDKANAYNAQKAAQRKDLMNSTEALDTKAVMQQAAKQNEAIESVEDAEFIKSKGLNSIENVKELMISKEYEGAVIPPPQQNPQAQESTLVIGNLGAGVLPVNPVQAQMKQLVGHFEMQVPDAVIAPHHPSTIINTPVFAHVEQGIVQAVYLKQAPTEMSALQASVEKAIVAALQCGKKEPLSLSSPGMRDDALKAAYEYCIVKGIAFKMPAPGSKEETLFKDVYKDLVDVYHGVVVGTSGVQFQRKNVVGDAHLQARQEAAELIYQLPVVRPDAAAVKANIDVLHQANGFEPPVPQAQYRAKL